jgi:RimJ/RimL family protein N-acetyltransferase
MAFLFRFEEQYVLEDAAVLLRPLVETDAVFLKPYSLHEPELWQYSLQTASGEENLKRYIQTAIDSRQQKHEYPFIVYDKNLQVYAGSTRFYDINILQKTLQLGYTWYGNQFWGTGLNKHCKFLLLSFAFDTCDFVRVEFRADNNNARSIAAMKSIGCREEGVLRSNTFNRDGSRRDSIILSILKSDWNDGVKEKLLHKLNSY